MLSGKELGQCLCCRRKDSENDAAKLVVSDFEDDHMSDQSTAPTCQRQGEENESVMVIWRAGYNFAKASGVFYSSSSADSFLLHDDHRI